MPFAYYDRLSPAQQASHLSQERRDRSTLALPEAPGRGPVLAIAEALENDKRAAVQRAAQALIDALVRGFAVPPIAVRVLAVRPPTTRELHGLYEPNEDDRRRRSRCGCAPAQKRQVVAFRSFLRTLVHEFLHHLDYEHFAFPRRSTPRGSTSAVASLANACSRPPASRFRRRARRCG